MKLIDIINEGPRDPNIFKAIFTAGIPGSGKTTIVKKLTAGTGMKMVSFDELYEYLLKRGSDEDNIALNKSSHLIDTKFSTYLDGRLGIVVDKTSWDYNRVSNIKEQLESLGYDTLMIYVNTDINVAKQRAKNRFQSTGRHVDDEYIDSVFKKLSGNLGKYQQEFSDRFIIIDNTVDNTNLDQLTQFAQKKIDRFLNARPVNQTAIRWIDDHR
jgi:predicted ABC-type ATPase